MNATQLAKTANGKAVEELDVLVVGAGFAGLYQLDHLRRLGRYVRAALSVLQRGALARLELQRTLSLVGGAARLFPPRRQEARSQP